MTYFKNKSVWSDFFGGSPTHEHKGSLSRISLSSGGAYVHNALFQNLGGSSNGGAIYCSSVTVDVLVEETSFIYCTPSGKGGALYLSITGECVITKVCGSRCRATSDHGMFTYVTVTNSYDKKNSFLHSSVCDTLENTYSYTTKHEYGKVLFESSNISNNQCASQSGIRSDCQSTSNSNEIGFNVKYSSLTNNKATYWICIEVYNSASTCIKQIQSSNLINNTQASSTSYGFIYTGGKFIFKDSTILGNTAKYQLCEYSGPHGSTISNCTIDFTTSSVTSGVIITNSPSTSFINKISGFSTGECKSAYDSFGGLIVTPDPTKIKRVKMTCDWNNNTAVNTKMITELIILICSFLY
jgi:predicted outer membrane repeat protein